MADQWKLTLIADRRAIALAIHSALPLWLPPRRLAAARATDLMGKLAGWRLWRLLVEEGGGENGEGKGVDG